MVSKRNFNDLEIYHLAHQLVLDTYELVKIFPQYEDNNLTSQFRRAATCQPLNIAEGSGAHSNKIFFNYLIFCYRSYLETEACLRLALDLNYISKEQFDGHFRKMNTFARKLYRYMEYLERQIETQKREKSYFRKQNKYYFDNDMKKREEMGRLS